MEKESLLLLAKKALHAERYDDMVDFMKQVVGLGQLSAEERSWLSSAYKNSIGTRRASWQDLHSVHHRAERNGEEQQLKLIELQQQKVEEELSTICQDVLKLLDDKLIPAASETDEKIFYFKMKGDYYRYISEFAKGEKHQEVANNALAAYEEASKVANSDLTPAHPLRLGLALKFSVFYFEVMSNPVKACTMAKSAYDEGLAEAEQLSEDMYQESSNILQSLRFNLDKWSADQVDNRFPHYVILKVNSEQAYTMFTYIRQMERKFNINEKSTEKKLQQFLFLVNDLQVIGNFAKHYALATTEHMNSKTLFGKSQLSSMQAAPQQNSDMNE